MGYTHAEFVVMFLALFIILVLGVILRFTLKNKPLAIRQIPLQIIAASLVLIEIVKQIYRISTGTWTTRCLPFHFCSFFLIWFAVALFTRGKTRQLMYFCSLTGGFIMTIVMYFAPRIILQEASSVFWDSFNHYHTFFFHMGVVAYWIWMLMLNIYQPDHHHVKKAIILYTTFYFVTIAGAFIFKENFADVLYPSLKVFDQFRLTAGQFAYDVGLLTVGVGLTACVAHLVFFATSKLYQHNLKENQKHALQIHD